MKSYTVDRIEGEYMILELPDGGSVDVPHILCPDAKEGDVLMVDISPEKKEQKLKNSAEKMNSIFKK